MCPGRTGLHISGVFPQASLQKQHLVLKGEPMHQMGTSTVNLKFQEMKRPRLAQARAWELLDSPAGPPRRYGPAHIPVSSFTPVAAGSARLCLPPPPPPLPPLRLLLQVRANRLLLAMSAPHSREGLHVAWRRPGQLVVRRSRQVGSHHSFQGCLCSGELHFHHSGRLFKARRKLAIVHMNKGVLHLVRVLTSMCNMQNTATTRKNVLTGG